MDYHKHYELLVCRAVSRELTGYSEKHHIIPRCIGGTNSKFNLVRLTAEEHYVAHQLLVKMYPDKPKLSFAAWCMTANVKGLRNNKQYSWLRLKFIDALNKSWTADRKKQMSERSKNQIMSSEVKQRLAELNSGKAMPEVSKNKMKSAWTTERRKAQAERVTQLNRTEKMTNWSSEHKEKHAQILVIRNQSAKMRELSRARMFEYHQQNKP